MVEIRVHVYLVSELPCDLACAVCAVAINNMDVAAPRTQAFQSPPNIESLVVGQDESGDANVSRH
jgi:hypothetical protein